MDDQMTALDPEGVDGLFEPVREAAPAVVEVLRALGEAEARKIDRDRAQSRLGERRDHLAIKEGARRDPVQEQDRWAVALLTDEAAHSGRLEFAPGGAVLLYDLIDAVCQDSRTLSAHFGLRIAA